MSNHDLLRMWLEEGARDRRERARVALESYERLQDRTTSYADAVIGIYAAHCAAARVYELALEAHDKHQPDSSRCEVCGEPAAGRTLDDVPLCARHAPPSMAGGGVSTCEQPAERSATATPSMAIQPKDCRP